MKLIIALTLVAAIAFVAVGEDVELTASLRYTFVSDLVIECLGSPDEIGSACGPPYIIRINNPDAVEELWIGDEMVDVIAWRPPPVLVFIAGAVLGSLVSLLLL